ncbi:ABC transporter substrate-binding protein [Blastococcus sp. Marseille-P5729]|uniref:ABC transporter substrate-binding protein n=1 Tax=Blastococcus sp. Marseille-P5729 TaxID=2086582 RepID=UPI000D0E9973|nr:ABC transporter substrate-binding protein [Blastococcus sp. Marseille-P5729]
MNKKLSAAAAGLATLTLAVTGCSTKASDDSGGGGGGGVQTDIGVTDDEITLTAFADLSGVFKVLSQAFTHGNQIWADEVNAAGGICERDIKINVQDTGYKVDLAVPIYESVKGTDLGAIQMVGSPILAALKQKIIADKMVVSPGSWASVNLDAPEVMMVGQTYDIEMLNGLSWLQQEGKIADGDKIGHIYTDSEYGQGAVMGSDAYAKEHNLEVLKAPLGATDTDMTATITKFKAEGVKAIAITTPPAAVSSTVVQNVAQGLNVPIIGSNPTFSPTMFSDQAVVDGLANYFLISSTAPYGTDIEIAKKVAAEYESRTQDEPNIGVLQAYVTGLVWGEVLKKACDNGDLTREGILEAKGQVDNVDTQGAAGAIDFSKEGAPSSREAFILSPDANAPDKLTITADLFSSEEAKAYKAPHEK